MKYKSLAEIDKDFRKRLDEASDDERQALQQAYSDARVEFLSAQLAARDLADAKRTILEKYPLAAKLESLITATDAESMETQAKAIHEQFESMQQPTAPPPTPAPAVDPAIAAYGRPGVGAGQPPAPPGPNQRQQELFRKMVGMGGGEKRSTTKGEAEEYLHNRAQEIFKAAKENGWHRMGTRGNQQE